MQYNAIISAIPRQYKESCKNGVVFEESSTNVQSRKIYEELCFDPNGIDTKIKAWELELDMKIKKESFFKCISNIYVVTNVSKYRSFQYRLLLRAIITNVHLFRWGLKQNNKCTFCSEEKETYLHLFVYCKKVQLLWIYVEQFMMRYNNNMIDFGTDKVVTNLLITDQPGHIKNFLCLITKQYIYRQRCLQQELSVTELKHNILQIERTEKYIATKNNKNAKKSGIKVEHHPLTKKTV